jgi:hypothetical protein
MSATPWYLSPLLLPPIFGLLGVLAGGLITFVSSYFLEERREERSREKENRERERELKRAARLLHADFLDVEGSIMTILKINKWWPDYEKVELPTWQECRPSLAPSLSREQWDLLTVAAVAITGLRGLRDRARTEKTSEIATPIVPFVQDVLAHVTQARKALEKMTLD